MKMVFTPEQKIFMIESYFHKAQTVHTFRKSGSVQRKPGSGRLKVCTEKNIETVQRQMENEQSYQCQLVKELFESILMIQ
jgi:hypothetical protein